MLFDSLLREFMMQFAFIEVVKKKKKKDMSIKKVFESTSLDKIE